MNNNTDPTNIFQGINYNPHSESNGNPFKDFARWLTSLDPIEFSVLGSIVGVIISLGLTVPEQNSFGNWLELVGQLILTVNAQASIINPGVNASQYQSNLDMINELQNSFNEVLKKFNDYENKKSS